MGTFIEGDFQFLRSLLMEGRCPCMELQPLPMKTVRLYNCEGSIRFA